MDRAGASSRASWMSKRRPDGFQRLAVATTAVTYLLILVGGLVRAAGAGLGCPDWPRCFGRWIPPTRAEDLPAGFDPSQFNAALTWIEYLNRLLGAATGFLIFATLVAAVARHRDNSRVLWPVVAAFVGVGFQGWLGGRVVAHQLAPWIVTVHLVAALIIVSLLIYATVNAFFPARSTAPAGRERARLGRLAYALIALTLGQVALGTQVRGAIDQAAGTLPRQNLVASVGFADMAHRNVALAVLAASIWLFVRTRSRLGSSRSLVAAATAVVVLAILQVAAGVVLAYFALPRPIQVAHLSIASLLLGAQTLLALLAFRVPSQDAGSAL